MKVTVTKCDGCGKELSRTSEIYKLYLTTERFWDGVENSCLYEKLDFCFLCANTIKNTLIKIAERLEKAVAEQAMEGGGEDG